MYFDNDKTGREATNQFKQQVPQAIDHSTKYQNYNDYNEKITTNLNTQVALNIRYTFTLSLTKGIATVNINGKDVYTKTPSASILTKKFYFKFGAYDQSTSSGPENATPYTLVETYTVDVVHQ